MPGMTHSKVLYGETSLGCIKKNIPGIRDAEEKDTLRVV